MWTPCLSLVGSDFERPRGLGWGPYRGVEVLDFGAGGLRHHEPVSDAATETIAGIPVWHHVDDAPPTGGEARDYQIPAERWEARVDDRFCVWSRDRALLVQTLARTGTLADLLRPFPAVHAMPSDVDSVVCTLPRPTDETYWGRMVPVETVVSCVYPTRVLFFHRQPLPKQYVGVERVGSATRPRTSRDGEWTVTERDVDMAGPWRAILIDSLFGLAIFI